VLSGWIEPGETIRIDADTDSSGFTFETLATADGAAQDTDRDPTKDAPSVVNPGDFPIPEAEA
jgi:hypothetical protein